MELRTFNRDKGPIILAVFALLAVGLGSMFLTLQSIRRQRDLVDQHMQLAGGAVVHGVEANLMRVMSSLRRSPDAASKFFPTIHELFREMTSSGDVVFIGIFDEDGHLVASSSESEAPHDLILPEEIIAALEVQGRWSGALVYRDKPAIFSAIRARASLSVLCEGARLGFPCPPEQLFPLRDDAQGGPRQGKGTTTEQRQPPPLDPEDDPEDMPGSPSVPGIHRSPEVPSMFLVAGLNPQRHLDQFQAYRRAALLQAGYVFGAASLLWVLAFAYLRRREQALKAARLERFQSKLLDNMPDGLVTLGPDGSILSANGSAARLLLADSAADSAPPRLIGRNWAEFPFAGLAAGAEGARPYQWRQFEHAGRVLEILCLPLQADASSAGAGGERMVLLRDRTRIKTLEDDLAEAKRLATIGSLAAGVAHEIRNPLSSLRGFAQLFATKLKGQEPLASYAATMVQEADRLNRVVTDLLFLARPRDLAPAEVDLRRLAESLRGLLRFDLEHRGVTPELDLQVDTVYADEDALKQCLLNLLVNALDALSQTEGTERRITISSRRSDPGQEPSGVWITVADTGAGMDETVREKAFEPFFTDKKQGTGLGLAIVQGIMRGHRGRAVIDSEPGQGTALRLFFPDPEGRHGHGDESNEQTEQ
ncbi:Signal transduction histidine kinase [Humidesulfovibrio mexicanus]|uniref:histidine kinase n=1 Tax=Humidesulfovibrio mexicanus TaxID=147047 RepID=A0A238YWI6_9BACT|nr:ATP-binding protein [Humidesulfovibrio mexicanus]SNR74994.1 Signal transduction histidine kinase [Humidesulfovibrio mexicanus]